MNTAEMTNNIRRKTQEYDNSEVLSDAVILSYIQESYRDVWKQVFPNANILTATLTLIGGETTLPTGFGTMYGDALDDRTTRFPEVSIADYHTRSLDRMVTIEAGKLKAYPLDTTSLEIRYWPAAETLTTGATPAIDPYFHEPIQMGALYRCYEDLQDEELSDFWLKRFRDELTFRIQNTSVYEETNQTGAVMFEHQNILGGGPVF